MQLALLLLPGDNKLPLSRTMSGPGLPVVYLSLPVELCEAPAVLTLTRMGLASASGSLALLPR
jgi:hypothetical protein